MNIAITDLGSNTVRLSIYEVKGNKFRLLMSKKEMASLAGYVENATMSIDGLRVASDVLENFKNIVEHFNITDFKVFATASLRNIKNSDACLEFIKQKTGITIDLLSGEEEALFDFKGALLNQDVKDGLLVDIGGGSTELVLFDQKKSLMALSLPFGSLSLYREFVSNIIAKEKELDDIRKYVKRSLPAISFGDDQFKTIIGVGGSIRAMRKLILKSEKKENIETITYRQIDDVYKDLTRHSDDKFKLILKTIPERIHTILPGMTTLLTIMDFYHIKALKVSNFGVREGYVYSRFIEKDKA